MTVILCFLKAIRLKDLIKIPFALEIAKLPLTQVLRYHGHRIAAHSSPPKSGKFFCTSLGISVSLSSSVLSGNQWANWAHQPGSWRALRPNILTSNLPSYAINIHTSTASFEDFLSYQASHLSQQVKESNVIAIQLQIQRCLRIWESTHFTLKLTWDVMERAANFHRCPGPKYLLHSAFSTPRFLLKASPTFYWSIQGH